MDGAGEEWAMFGSDDDYDDDDIDDSENLAAEKTDNNGPCPTTTTRSVKEDGEDHDHDKEIKRQLKTVADSVALFLTQTWVRQSSCSKHLFEKYFSIPAIPTNNVHTDDVERHRESGSGAFEREKRRFPLIQIQTTLMDLVADRIILRGVNIVRPSLAELKEATNEVPLHGRTRQRNVVDASVVCRIADSISLTDRETNVYDSSLLKSIVPGGHALLFLISRRGEDDADDSILHNLLTNTFQFHDALWDISGSTTLGSYNIKNVSSLPFAYITVLSIQKREFLLNKISCEWKTSRQDWIDYERQILSEVTVPLSAHERIHQVDTANTNVEKISDGTDIDKSPRRILHQNSIRKAVKALRTHGFCVIRDLFLPEDIIPWGDAVCADASKAVAILKESHNVDLLHPNNDGSAKDPLSYRELSMREDLRLDIRDGPSMRRLRENENSRRLFYSHPSVLQIITEAFYPRDPTSQLHRGNYGRWNFDGSGPDAPPPRPRAGKLGAVLSFPGAACQAIHSDTPHLFEHADDVPPHYINMFMNGSDLRAFRSTDRHGDVTGESPVGGTAVVAGSHRLSTCADLTYGDDDSISRKDDLNKRIVRPSLNVGDVLLFDCRVLHFGLANQASVRPVNKNVDDKFGWRPMLYVNFTTQWFNDPKNWDNNAPIFPDGCYSND